MESGRTLRLGRLPLQVSALNLLLWALGAVLLGEVLLGRGFAARGEDGFGSLLDLGGIGIDVLLAAGADGPRAVFRNHEVWRLFSAMFLHCSVIHWLMNSGALFQLGRVAESIYGGGRLLLVFLVTGVAGNLASDAWYGRQGGTTVSAGASGAVCGLLGLLLYHMRKRKDVAAEWYGRQLLQWAILTLVMGLVVPFINNAAHAGGFAAGYLLGAVLLPRDLENLGGRGPRAFRRTLTALLVLTAVASLAVAGLRAPARLRLLTGGELLLQHANEALVAVKGRPEAPAFESARLAVEAVTVPEELAPAKARAVAALAPEPLSATARIEGLVRAIGEIGSILVATAPDLWGTVPSDGR